jgi:hypothetical protein
MSGLRHFHTNPAATVSAVTSTTITTTGPHQGLHGIPNAPPEQPETGEIMKKPMVFGLHNHYYREAA